ncbi:uncharacterized protein CTRU02_212803 [Colletotrichum truncatum]|uniref:Integral membrane protein n=1 Tax=Colletotrichum truncatum TaxID=5467 RepID=A0ACC3YIW7_COLTU|nr:uncharacterized protein CTRU02_03125 [Colletotrichum truncatum]KAF6797094.1 integral membrane protein [Colletotrichum truncatum]
MGLHFDLLSLEQKQGAIFWTMVGFPAGVMSFGLPKVAVVALLTKILNPSPWHRRLLWGLSLFCLLNLTANMVLLFTHCLPTRSLWDFSVTGRCLSKWTLVSFAIYSGGILANILHHQAGQQHAYLNTISFGAFVDAYLAVYPSVVLSKLQMSLKKKIALSVALGIGSISTIVAIYKCTRVPSLASQDFTYDTADLVIWTIVEGGTMIIAACIPVLQPLSDLVFGKRIFGSGNGRRTYENYGSGPGGQLKSEPIELSRSHKPRRRTQRQVDEISIDDADTMATTAVAKGSQESILEQHNFKEKIVRTDVFSIRVEPR